MSFPRVLAQCEMQIAASRIWTRVAVSISYEGNHYDIHVSITNCIRFGGPKQEKRDLYDISFIVGVYKIKELP